MSRDSHQPAGRRPQRRPFDPDAEAAADLTQQFWGGTRGWGQPIDQPLDRNEMLDDEQHRFDQFVADDDQHEMWSERTGASGADRSMFGAGRSRRAAITARNRRVGGVERTRSHGIVRPVITGDLDEPFVSPRDAHTGAVPRARAADGDATLGQLASGHRHADAPQLDWDDDDWDLLPATTRQRAVVPARDHTGRDHTDRDHTGSVQRTRAHRAVDATFEHELALEPAPRRLGPAAPLAARLGLGAVDPLLLRLGALALTGALALPFLFGSHDDDGSLASAEGTTPAPAAVMAAPATTSPSTWPAGSGSGSGDTAADPASAPAAPASDAAAPGDQSNATPSATTQPAASSDGARSAQSASDAPSTVGETSGATVQQPADRVQPTCSLEYEAAAGDSWYRIADAAGIAVDELLSANLADLDAPIFPGDSICLPEGASMPAAPTTTVAPTTTAAPTTTTTVAPASPDDVVGLIREIWPDELEEKALAIAKRESGYHADAYNGFCCYGVFQIYYTAHTSWLPDYGVNQASDLFDARKNVTVAYALYQRAGGWGPWGG